MAKRISAPLLQSHGEQPLRHAVTALLLAVGWVLLLMIISVILKRLVAGDAKPLTLAVTAPDAQATPAAPDEQGKTLGERILGTWQNFYHGDRTLTIRPDGTATMVVVLHGIKARLFTPRLQLEMVWSIKDGCMMRRTTGGKPADKVAFVNRYVGRQVMQPILKLTDTRLVLRDQENATRHEWHRVDDHR